MGDMPWQPPYEQPYSSLSTAMIHSSSSSLHGNIIRKDPVVYGMPDFDQSLLFCLDGQDESHAQAHPQTLNIFPSQPMHVEPPSKFSMASAPDVAGSSKRLPAKKKPRELSKPTGEPPVTGKVTKATVKKEGGHGKGETPSSSEHEGPRTPDPKTLRRLAQNREAARKSRLRKKVYIQHLETSRIRLSQLEQELQKGVLLGGGALPGDHHQPVLPGINGGLSPEAATFNVQYGMWVDEHHTLMSQLRAAADNERLPDAQLRPYVDVAAAHYGVLMGLKAAVAKADALHLVSGAWKAPAERGFLWIGGFRPTELIKIAIRQVEPLTEQQIVSICGVQQSAKEAEDVLENGLQTLHCSLSETISFDGLPYPPDMAACMGPVSLAMVKYLTSLEGFVRQADGLRLQTLQKLPEIMTTRQSARCFLAVAEYFRRLRALGSLCAARPAAAGGRLENCS